MFAILKTGGKQYKVAKEEKLLIEKIDGNIGDEVVFNDIIMINDCLLYTSPSPRDA